MKKTKQLTLSARANHRSLADKQVVTSAVASKSCNAKPQPKPAIAELIRGLQAGKDWAASTAATVEPWRIEALQVAIGQWEFEAKVDSRLPAGIPVFMASSHFDGATLFAGHAAINAAQGKISTDYVRGFAVGALSAWADVTAEA